MKRLEIVSMEVLKKFTTHESLRSFIDSGCIIKPIRSDTVDINIDDCDINVLGEKNSERVKRGIAKIIEWLEMPILTDDFETHNDRIAFRQSLGSPEILKRDKIRLNKIHSILARIEIFIALDKEIGFFSEEEKKDIQARRRSMNNDFAIITSVVGANFKTAHEAEQRMIEFGISEPEKAAEGEPTHEFIRKQRIKIIGDLEKLCLEVISKFVNEEKRENRLMMEAAASASIAPDEDTKS